MKKGTTLFLPNKRMHLTGIPLALHTSRVIQGIMPYFYIGDIGLWIRKVTIVRMSKTINRE